MPPTIMLLGASLAVLGWSMDARADPLSQVAVEWDAPVGCPARSVLIDELRRDLEGTQVQGVQLVVRARVEHPRADAWRVSIATESREGFSERSVSAHTCSALLEATSLIIAMMVDPETAAAHAPTIDETEGLRAEPLAPVASLDSRASPVSGPTGTFPTANTATAIAHYEPLGDWRWNPAPKPRSIAGHATTSAAAALAIAVDYGSLPGVTAAMGGELGIMHGRWRGEANILYFLPKSETASQEENPSAGGEFGRFEGRARLCFNPFELTKFSVGPCVAMGAARLSGQGNDALPRIQEQHKWVPVAGIGVVSTLKLTHAVALRSDWDVSFPLNRPRFGYTYASSEIQVFQPSVVAVRAGLGVEVQFDF